MGKLTIADHTNRSVEAIPLVMRRRHLGGNLRRQVEVKAVLNVSPPWWANPAILMGLFIIPVYTLVYVIPVLFGTDSLQLRSAIYFESRYFGLGMAFLASGLVGCILGQLIQPAPPPPGKNKEEYVSALYLEALALLTISAYLIWFRDIFLSPKALLSIIKGGGELANIRRTSQTIGGITTLTQCGIAFIILYLDRVWGQNQPLLPWRFKVYIAMVIGLSLFRAYAWAERLALIELMVPIGLLFFCYRGRSASPIIHLLRIAGPVIGVVALIGFFGVMEFFRSWSAHYVDVEDSFWGFVMKRFLAYYYTALNNGAGLLLTTGNDWPTYTMEHVLSWLYRFPALIGPIFHYAFDVQSRDGSFLTRYADPEFNNMSGIFVIFYDMGVPGTLVYALFWGGLAGASYASVRARRGMLRVLYPLFFLSILEVMRVTYLSDARAFPALLAVIVGYSLFRARIVVPTQLHQIRRARRHSTVEGGRWYRPRFGRFFGR